MGGLGREDVEQLPALPRFGDEILDCFVGLAGNAEDRFDLGCGDVRPGLLVANGDEVALLAALLEGVGDGVAGREAVGEAVGFHVLAAAAALEDQVAQLFVEAVVGFELADLEGEAVAEGIADRADQDLRVGDVGAREDDVHEQGQLLLQDDGYAAHRTRDVEDDGDRQRQRMLGAVAALARAVRELQRIECSVDAARLSGADGVVMAEIRPAGGAPRAHAAHVVVCAPSAATHVSLLSGLVCVAPGAVLRQRQRPVHCPP
jgi:hypothetical protein